MIYSQEIASSVLLLCAGGVEQALVVRMAKGWWKLVGVFLPILVLVHAISWVYTLPLQQARLLLENSALATLRLVVLPFLIVLYMVLPLVASRSSHPLGARLDAWGQAMPSWALLLAIYHVVVRHYSWLVGKSSFQILGGSALPLVFILGVSWYFSRGEHFAHRALRPFLLILCWIVFEL